MFTGIVQEVGKVLQSPTGQLTVVAPATAKGAELGESIAVNGVCLTVTRLTADSFTVSVMPETLRRSNLGVLRPGSPVNLEPAMSLNGKLGGHLVQGHVDGTGKVSRLTEEGGAVLAEIAAPPEVMKYTVEKGFIAIDGVSLTISSRNSGSFTVSVVEYTRKHTIIENWRTGTVVNLEIDIIAKYVAQMLQVRATGITGDFLQEHGFSA
jgi:riboflavin synthase